MQHGVNCRREESQISEPRDATIREKAPNPFHLMRREAVSFANLKTFVPYSSFDSALASSLFYLSFVTLTSNRLRDIVPVHPWREVSAMSKASLVNSIRRRFWPGL